jgi:adenylate cyclase
MFTDLQGYTSLAETLDPHLLASLLDDYLSAMIGVVLDHDGTLLGVAGDGLNVLFGAPQRQPDHAARALACALALDICAENFRARWRTRGVHIGMTRIGVNSGPALVGSFGGHAGGYAAHGETINIAARLEAANKLLGTRICLSGSVVERLPDFHGCPSGNVVLRDREPAVPVYEPRADGSSPAWQHGRAQTVPPG